MSGVWNTQRVSRVGLSGAGVAFVLGYGISSFNAVSNILSHRFLTEGIAESEGRKFAAFATLLYCAAALLGSVVGGSLSDARGRKAASLTCIGLLLLAGVLEACFLAFPPSRGKGGSSSKGGSSLGGGLIMYLGGHTLLGVAEGLQASAYMYVLELAPRANVRAYLAALWQICFTIGVAAPNILSMSLRNDQAISSPSVGNGSTVVGNGSTGVEGDGLTDEKKVAAILLLPAIVSLFLLPLAYKLPESPVYLSQNPQASNEEISTVLSSIDNDLSITPAPLNEPHYRLRQLRSGEKSLANTTNTTQNSGANPSIESTKGVMSDTESAASYREVLTSREFALGAFYMTLLQATGVNLIFASSNLHLVRMKFSPESARQVSSGLTFAQILFSLPLFLYVDKFPRLVIIRYGAFGCAVSALLILIQLALRPLGPSKPVILAGLFGFVASWAAFLGGVVYLYANEMLPPRLRSKAYGVLSAINWLAFAGVVAGGSLLAARTVFAAAVAGSFTLCLFTYLLPETAPKNAGGTLADQTTQARVKRR